MGVVNTITYDRFPKQGSFLGKRVEVCFHYDTEHTFMGTIVRDDREEPYVTIIKLDNGLFVLTDECQYHPVKEEGLK